MANLHNFGHIQGRLTRDVSVMENKDGSKKVLLNIAVRNSYKTKGEYQSQFINLQAFVRKEVTFDKSVYAYMHKGDLITVEFEVRSNVYEKDGKTVYDQVLFVTNVALDETKKAKEARQTATMPEDTANMVADDAAFN